MQETSKKGTKEIFLQSNRGLMKWQLQKTILLQTKGKNK